MDPPPSPSASSPLLRRDPFEYPSLVSRYAMYASSSASSRVRVIRGATFGASRVNWEASFSSGVGFDLDVVGLHASERARESCRVFWGDVEPLTWSVFLRLESGTSTCSSSGFRFPAVEKWSALRFLRSSRSCFLASLRERGVFLPLLRWELPRQTRMNA